MSIVLSNRQFIQNEISEFNARDAKRRVIGCRAYIAAEIEIKQAIEEALDEAETLELWVESTGLAPKWWIKRTEYIHAAHELRLTWIDRMLELGYIA